MHKKISIYLISIVVISVGVYFNSFYNKFVFDDIHIVENNPLVKNPKNLFLLFKSEYGAQTDFAGVKLYRPLVMVSYLLTNTFFGNNPFWHHLGNVILQTVNVIFVFLLCKYLLTVFYKPILTNRSGKEDIETTAFFCGLLFAVHPVHTEVVAGIVGRFEILAGFFCFVSFLFFIKNKFLPSMIAFFLALLSKENAAALLGFIFLYEILFNKKLSKSIIGFFGFCLFISDLVYRNKKLIKILPPVLLIFSFITVKQNTVWKNNILLWTYTTQKFPKNWRAFWELGKCYRAEKNAEEAIKYFKKSLLLRETDLVLYDLAVELRKKGDCPAAIELLNKLIGINKKDAKAYIERAKCFGQLGDYKNAVSNFHTAALFSPKNDNIFYETGRFFLLRGDLSLAKNNFEKAVELNGKNANALVGIGVCFYQTNNFQKAKNYFSEALKIDSKNIEALYNLIVVNISLSNKEEAKTLFEKYRSMFPNDEKIDLIKLKL